MRSDKSGRDAVHKPDACGDRSSAMAVDDATTWKEFNDTVNMTAAEL